MEEAPPLYLEKNKIISYLNFSHDEKFIIVGE
jgi:hypothetical protein